ncbi:MAG: hypothetical protein WBN68_07565 [Sedimenticolaceae bacterium]
MKFHQIPPGAAFRYKDTVYRKVSPLKGANEADGSHRLIPRSAEVTLLDEGGPAVPATPLDSLTSRQVTRAIEELVSAFPQIAARLDPPLSPSQFSQLEMLWTNAAQDLLTRLAIRP